MRVLWKPIGRRLFLLRVRSAATTAGLLLLIYYLGVTYVLSPRIPGWAKWTMIPAYFAYGLFASFRDLSHLIAAGMRMAAVGRNIGFYGADEAVSLVSRHLGELGLGFEQKPGREPFHRFTLDTFTIFLHRGRKGHITISTSTDSSLEVVDHFQAGIDRQFPAPVGPV